MQEKFRDKINKSSRENLLIYTCIKTGVGKSAWDRKGTRWQSRLFHSRPFYSVFQAVLRVSLDSLLLSCSLSTLSSLPHPLPLSLPFSLSSSSSPFTSSPHFPSQFLFSFLPLSSSLPHSIFLSLDPFLVPLLPLPPLSSHSPPLSLS